MRRVKYFYQFLSYRLWIALVLSTLTAILDGIGIAMFIPILEIAMSGTDLGEDSLVSRIVLMLDINQELVTLELLIIIMSSLFVIKAVSLFCSKYYNSVVQQNFMLAIRERLTKALADMYFMEFLEMDSGTIQNNLTGEVGRATRGVNQFISVFQNLLTATIYLIMATLAHSTFALTAITAGIAFSFLFWSINRTTRVISTESSKLHHNYTGQVLQFVTSFKYLKATNSTAFFKDRVMARAYDIRNVNLRLGFINAMISSIKEPLAIVVLSMTMILEIRVFHTDMATLMLSVLLVFRSLNFLLGSQNAYNLLLGVSGSLESIDNFLAEAKVSKESLWGLNDLAFVNKIELKNVTYDYGNNLGVFDVDIKLLKGNLYTITGESGSGKTTLANIITGLLENYQGQMMINDINIKNFKRKSYQSRIGYISQEPIIYSGSIFNNVTMWSSKSDENIKRFVRSCDLASFKEVIDTFPKGEESSLSLSGLTLSGGQRQRLSIAREFFKQTEILIFDEPTSALDFDTAQKLLDNINTLKEDKIVIIISHDATIINRSDNVILLSGGRLNKK